jgi:hypothetical protein
MSAKLQRNANAWRALLLAVEAAAPIAAYGEDAFTLRAADVYAPSRASEGRPPENGAADNAKSPERKPPENRPLVSTRPEDEQKKGPSKD